MINLSLPCVVCGRVQELSVPAEGYELWKAGALIQYALPTLTDDERELLTSGMCPRCFDDTFLWGGYL